jgi:ABC-type sulfate transport system substrate-binding protein
VNDEDPDYVNPNFSEDDGTPNVWADVTILEGDDAGVVYPNASVSGKYIHEALAFAASTKETVLGRVDKGRRAFFINEASEEDEKIAEEFFANGAKAPADDSEEIPF